MGRVQYRQVISERYWFENIKKRLNALQIRDETSDDKEWKVKVLKDSWASTLVVSRGVVHNADDLPGIIAIKGEQKIGLLTYNIVDQNLEIVTLNSLREREGVGRALIRRIEEIAQSKDCKKIWVVTTNDNTNAILFYKALNFRIIAIHKNAIKKSRELKPEIPLIGNDGVPITDEIVLEKIIS